jgi:serine protease AprX
MAGHTLKRRLWRWAPGAFVLGFALSLALFGGKGYATPDNVHAAVYQWAAQHPGENVPVIFETSGDTSALVSDVTSAGGSVGHEFNIIPAVSASVPVSALPELAGDSSVAFVGLDAPVLTATASAVKTNKLATTYAASVGATDAWSSGFDGAGVGVAVIDTGVTPSDDFVGNAANFNTGASGSQGGNRIIANVAVNGSATTTDDGFGHGTHIAGSIAGDGSLLSGKYIGIAPGANVINVKVSDDKGGATLSDVIAGMEFVFKNSTTYNIRVVNMSLNTSVAQSYKTDPLCAAAEALWFHGIFVVTAAGNSGNAADAVGYCPGNDPFVMTVGSIDDGATASYGDDVPASWSSFGTTQDGFTKPELLTPGVGIISDMSSSSRLYQQHPSNVVDQYYFSMSGTSMSAGVMSGVAALVLQSHPDWKPGQLKCTLISTSRPLAGNNSMFRVPRAGDASSQSMPTCDSDTGIAPSVGFGRIVQVGFIAGALDQMGPVAAATYLNVSLNDLGLANFVPGTTFDLSMVNWSAIKWDAIKWDSIKWDSIKWDSIKWDSIKWDSIKWDSIKWDSVKWDSVKWDSIKWDSIKWDSIKWDSIKWDSIKWDSIKWDSKSWHSKNWDSKKGNGIKWDTLFDN